MGWIFSSGAYIKHTSEGVFQSFLSVTVSASAARGKSDGHDVTYSNTRIEAGNTVGLQSGGDTTLQGAVVAGRTVQADIGGNLSIESLQDTSVYASKQASIGGSLTVGAGVSGSVSASSSKSSGNFASVAEQSGIQAGDGGFDVNVKGNTDLKGGVIASTNKAVEEERNRLITATLTTSDIQNKAEASAKSSGINLSSDMLSQGKYGAVKAAAGTALGSRKESGNSAGRTRSTLSAGTVTLTDDTAQQAKTGKTGQEAVASLNRDTANAQTAAVKQDAQAMQQTVEAERAITQEAVKQITVIGDKVYRKETEAKKLVNITCQESKAACSQAVVTLAQIEAVNGKITAFNNGMLNDEQAALVNAYMQTTGQQLQGCVIVVVNPMINDVVSEAAWVAWKKVEEVFGFGTSSMGDLNLALQAIALTQGAKLDTRSHSAGNFDVAEMLRRLDEIGTKDAAIGTATMFGSPVNAQGTANTVNTITSGQGAVQHSTHKNNFVGTVFGENSATGGIDAPFKDAHSAYAGSLPPVFNADGRENPVRNLTDTVWGDGKISQPAVIPPTQSETRVQELLKTLRSTK